MDSKIRAANLLRWVARLAGTIALILGALFWAGLALSAIAAHAILGIITAAALGLVALIAAIAGARVPAALSGIVWAAATVYVGYNQNSMMTGSGHWVIEAAHLILGVGAIGMAEALAAGIRAKRV